MEDMGENTDREIQSLSNSVACLFLNGLLTDIECRKIVCTKELDERRAAICQILVGRNVQEVENILDVFRSNIHPLMNSFILERAFSFLNVKDLRNCYLVCQKWNVVAESLINKRRKPHSVSSSPGKSGQIVKNAEGKEIFPRFCQKLFEKITAFKTANANWDIVQIQAVVGKLILSNDSVNGEILLQIFQHFLDIEGNVQLCVADDDDDGLASCNRVSVANALQNDAVLNRLFRFLPFNDIQSCRMVSRQWNSLAEPFVINRGLIIFTARFRPDNFTDAFKYSNFPNLTFNAFKFATNEFGSSELEEFFGKRGPIIQNLHLGHMDVNNTITTGLSRTNNLNTFQLRGYFDYTNNIQLMLPWNKFHAIQNLDLRSVVLNADADITKRKIRPQKIHLNHVRFSVGGGYPDLQIYFNDYLNFSKAREINITSLGEGNQIFNWASDVIDAERITFTEVEFENLPPPKSRVDYLKLYCSYPFSTRNHLEIKQLLFEDGIIELSALPPTLQKLSLAQRWHTEILVDQPIDLPILEFFSFRKGRDFHEIAYFKNCPKLVDMEILGLFTLDVTWLPRNIKRIKLETPFGDFDFVGDDPEYIELDVLSLDFISTPFLNKTLMKVRPKVLVFIFKGVYEDNSFIGFLRRNNHVQKIYVQFSPRVLSNEVFENSLLAALVDRKSDFYEFNNDCGKAISYEEFKSVQSQVDIMTTMSPFWNY